MSALDETLAYWHERIIEIHSKDQAIVAMGDFNDEPFNRSLVEYALSERAEKRVKSKRSRSPYLLNLMWPLMGSGRGSHQYGGVPGMLDQILVNRPVLRSDSPFELDPGSVQILDFDEMVAESGSEKGGPRRYGRPSKSSSYDPNGYSDHFPVGVMLSES